MIETRITCDRCGLSIQPLDAEFDTRQTVGGGSLISIARSSGGMGHNQIPPGGWHFHYNCAHSVIQAINKFCDARSPSDE